MKALKDILGYTVVQYKHNQMEKPSHHLQRQRSLTMLVMEAAGAGEEEFPRCTGAGDLVTRCCL